MKSKLICVSGNLFLYSTVTRSAVKVLVTGGSGFLGSHVCTKLLKKRDGVVIFDLKPPEEQILTDSNVSYVQGDIRDESAVEEAASDCNATIHLAAIADVDTCQQNPRHALQVNVEGTRVVLESARWNYHKKFIFASSAAVYGDQKKMPINEDCKLMPRSIYGVTKASAELLVNSYSYAYSFPCTVLRFFNIYGPNPGYAGVIPSFIRGAVEHGRVTIFGSGRQTRDFIYVDDAADAVVKSLHSSKKGIYNVGTGKESSVLKIASIVERVTGKKIHKEFRDSKESEIMRSVADITKIVKEIGWRPKTNIVKGIKNIAGPSQ